jgi:hypothetical protein
VREAPDRHPSFFFFAKKFFRGPAHAGANESKRRKCSGFWLTAPRQKSGGTLLLPAFTFGADIGARRLALGSRIQ